VAIVRGHDPLRARHQWVVVEVDDSAASDGVLRRALDEAQLRGVPLRVLMTWQSRFTDIHDSQAVADGNRLAKAQLDRRLAQWKKRYPDIDVRAVAAHCSTLNFLTKNARSIQLLIVRHERAQGITAIVGPPGYAALQNADCSVLICASQNVS
jgi:nucleotide-binding universal stress UspA family protein